MEREGSDGSVSCDLETVILLGEHFLLFLPLGKEKAFSAILLCGHELQTCNGKDASHATQLSLITYII